MKLLIIGIISFCLFSSCNRKGISRKPSCYDSLYKHIDANAKNIHSAKN